MPQASDDWQPLHPISPLLRGVQGLVVAAIIGVQSLDLLLSNIFVSAIAAAVVVVLVFAFGFVSYLFTRYRVRPDNFDFRQGVLFRAYRDVPLARLESVDIAQPLIPRLFGLGELRIEVAGAKDSDVRLRYLSIAKATELREFLLDVKRGETEPSPTHEEALILRADNRDVLFGYLVLPILGPVVAFGVTAIVTTFIDPALGFGLGFGGFFGVAALAFAFARGLERVWGFRVSRTNEGFVVQRGLLSLLTQKVPLNRVQSVRIETPVTWRLIKRARLVVDIAGYQSGERGERQETSVLLPIGSSENIRLLLDEILPDAEIDESKMLIVPHRARYRLPLVWSGYKTFSDRRYVITRRRILREFVDVVPHRKVQSLRITQGPWQRRLDLATLHYDTAGNNIAAAAHHRSFDETTELAARSRESNWLSGQ